MHRPALLVSFIAALAVAAPGQFRALFKFDEGCGANTLDLGTVGTRLRPVTTTGSSAASPWVAGRWGTALRGHDGQTNAVVNSARLFSVQAGRSFTLAFWLRERSSQGNGNSVLIDGGMLVHIPLTELETRVGGPPLRLQQNVRAMAKYSWVHIALVHDATSLTVTYYLNGQAEPPINLAAPLTGGTADRFGNGFHDLDEIFFEPRALGSSELNALATRPQAGASQWSSGCNAMTVSTFGGLPEVGNANFAVRVSNPSASATYLVGLGFGNSMCSAQSWTLPLHLGTLFPNLNGCHLVTSQNLLILPISIPAQRTFVVPMPIPLNALPTSVYVQPLGLDANTVLPVAGNGLAIAIGG